MKIKLSSIGRVLLTLLVVAVAAVVLWRLIRYYMFAPWTRDGHIRADVVQIAPDVTGLIDRVDVTDNQIVHKGQVLFVIDQARFKLALAQAQTVVAERRATLDQLRREAARNRTLGDLVAKEAYEESQSKVQTAAAMLAQAEVAVGVAQLNLERTVIVSPSDGYLNDRAPRGGEFVTAGRAVLSIVDAKSFHVDGYFEETKMPSIAIGQRVEIHLMGEPTMLHGHITSIAAAIEDRDRSQGANLLPNVNPAFSWVRLAQRIPVRIAFDDVPANVRLIAGRTATVSIENANNGLDGSVLHKASAVSPASGPWAPSPVTGVAAEQENPALDRTVLPPGSTPSDMAAPPVVGRPGSLAADALSAAENNGPTGPLGVRTSTTPNAQNAQGAR